MKEKIKIILKTHSNKLKGPSFRIYCDDNLIVENKNYKEKTFETNFELDLNKGPHNLKIEHFNKHPKDTLKGLNLDVAIQLEEISFNSIKCNLVDLHQNYFYTSYWPYLLEKKIKDNLYFGYNGTYNYYFETPSISYVLAQKKKYQKNISSINNFEITEEDFIKKLENFIINKN